MNPNRLAAVLGIGLAGSQAGHLLVYELRFGAAASQLQSAGAHAYFPALAKTGLGLAALMLLSALFVIGVARVLAGRRIEPGSAPSFWRLLPVLYTVQLACFAGQETAEALVGGGHASSAPLLLLWGAAGQLPVSVVAALAVRWLLARLTNAAEVLRIHYPPAHRVEYALAPVQISPSATTVRATDGVVHGFNRRGPPSF